ncbi:MAG: hypothetical protein RLY58_1341 [Pseudomonadota bacterium]|jgi:Rps23 Pro-64 3,4-dihydroxylase Tpa1-like proline 4-hydroxylase
MRVAGNQLNTAIMTAMLWVCVGMIVSNVSYAEISTMPEVKARWYRYYNNGTPTISGVITQEHVRLGYDALNSNMMVIRHVPPFTQEAYDRQKAQREQQEAKRQADRNLVLAHISSTQATAKRDQMLAEMTSRMQYLNTQMIDLQNDLGRDVAAAAAYERRQTEVPQVIQTRMKDKREQIGQMQRNIAALQKRQDDIRSSYAQIITRLDYLERNRSASSINSSATP